MPGTMQKVKVTFHVNQGGPWCSGSCLEMELHPGAPEGSLQHALLLLAKTEAHVVPAVLEASAFPPQTVTPILRAVSCSSCQQSGARTHLVFCDTRVLGAPGTASCPSPPTWCELPVLPWTHG